MSETTDSMLGVLPPLIIGGALLMFTEKFINKPLQTSRRKAKRFDELEYRDLKKKSKGLGYGDFSNIGW